MLLPCYSDCFSLNYIAKAQLQDCFLRKTQLPVIGVRDCCLLYLTHCPLDPTFYPQTSDHEANLALRKPQNRVLLLLELILRLHPGFEPGLSD